MTLSITQIVLICFGFFMLGGWCGVGLMCLMAMSKQADQNMPRPDPLEGRGYDHKTDWPGKR